MATQIIEDFRIDISHEQSFKYLQAKQYDHNSRVRRLVITDNNIPITFKGTEVIALSLEINGENYSNTTCPFDDDGYPYITFTEAMLSRTGDVHCEIRIYDNSESSVTTTFTFTMTVSKSLLNQDRLVSSSEFNILNDLIVQAAAIPDLIKDFNLNQEEAKKLIETLKENIQKYSTEFNEIKNKYTSDFNKLLERINSDITSYQETFNTLNENLTHLQTNITLWYSEAQEAENKRVEQENKRQTNTAEAIKKCETATSNANTATESANTASSKANDAALFAQNQADRVEEALQDFEFRKRMVDGGNLSDTSPLENLYDGGTL